MKRFVATALVFALLLVSFTAYADAFSDMVQKAEAYRQAGDYKKAIACFQLVQKINPESETGYLGEAGIQILQNNYASATALVDSALEKNPISQEAWKLKCKLDVLQDDIEAFETDCVFAAVCEADIASEYVSIAAMYVNAGMYEQAVTYYQLVDKESLNEDQQEQYGRALVFTGNRAVAEQLGLVTLSDRNTELDSKFENSELALIKAETPQIRVEDFEFPAELWKALEVEEPADPYAELATDLGKAEFTWLSFSPTGNSGILLVDGVTPVTYHNGKFHIMFPSNSRGVADENGNLQKFAHTRIQSLIGSEGVIYSDDGRYAGIYNIDITLIQSQWFIDPIIIDLSTGEMILTATYKNKWREENVGAVAAATFSADGKYLYYVLYGRMTNTDFNTSLYRYNLESHETEFCYSGSDFTYYPGLIETQMGSFLILRDTMKVVEYEGIFSIDRSKGGWTGDEILFDLPLQYWNCNRLLSSFNSGYVIALGRVNGITYAFQCFEPDEAFSGLNKYAVVMKESNELKILNSAELNNIFEDITKEATVKQATLDTLLPFHALLSMEISPDGHYALLLTAEFGTAEEAIATRHLYLVRLSDLAMKEVSGVDPHSILVGSLGANFKPIMEWSTGAILINTTEGIHSYKFQ